MKETLNIVITRPKTGDERSFEEYEKSISYEWISDLGLVENRMEGKHYEINGSYDDCRNIAVLLYGYNNNLSFIKGKQGFMLSNIVADERVLKSGELDHVWISSFHHYIKEIPTGVKCNQQGEMERKRNGEVLYNYKYDYFWFVLPCSENPQIDIGEYDIIEDNNLKYCVLWLR